MLIFIYKKEGCGLIPPAVAVHISGKAGYKYPSPSLYKGLGHEGK